MLGFGTVLNVVTSLVCVCVLRLQVPLRSLVSAFPAAATGRSFFVSKRCAYLGAFHHQPHLTFMSYDLYFEVF
jgi:hypothetical protein